MADLVTKQPPPGTEFSAMPLGGTTLYGPNEQWLQATVERIRTTIEYVTAQHLLLVRGQICRLMVGQLEETVADRVFGAILGLSLRLGVVAVLPCLTVNGRILRMYFNSQNSSLLQEKLQLLERLLSANTAVSVEAAQASCFPDRGWSTEFTARQLLCHLAYTGRAVLIDEDLFKSPISTMVNALRSRRG